MLPHWAAHSIINSRGKMREISEHREGVGKSHCNASVPAFPKKQFYNNAVITNRAVFININHQSMNIFLKKEEKTSERKKVRSNSGLRGW